MKSDKVYSKTKYTAFNPKLLNTLKINHPYHKVVQCYFDNYKVYPEDYDAVEEEGYFEILDNFYRYGYTFTDNQILLNNFVILYFLDFIDEQECWYYINLGECDTGELTLSAIEK